MRIGIVDHRQPRWKNAITASFSRFKDDVVDIPHDDPSQAERYCIDDLIIIIHSDALWQWIEELHVLPRVQRVVVVSDDEISSVFQSRLHDIVKRENWLVFSSVSRICFKEDNHKDRFAFLRDLGVEGEV